MQLRHLAKVLILGFFLMFLPNGLRARVIGLLEVELIGDKISISGYNNHLGDLLKDLARKGVEVHIDPSIRVKLQGKLDIQEEVFEEAMDRILEGYSYIAQWEIVEGPVGSWPRLRELRIFRSNAPQRAQAAYLEDTTGLRLTQDAKGNWIVQDEILIGMKPGTKVEAFKAVLSRMRGVVVESIPALGIYRIRLPDNTPIDALVAETAKHSKVAAVEAHYVYRPVGTTPLVGNLPVPALRRPSVGQAVESQHVQPIAVLDTGLSPSLDLGVLVRGTYDATKAANAQGVLEDTAGHGSQMALIASGIIQPAGSTAGRDTTPVLAIRAFDDDGRATGFSLMQSIDYALANGSRVLSLSWGSNANSTFLEGAMRYAADQGAVIVAAAGNEPTGYPVYPAAYEQTIAVAALDATGKRWSQSNYGKFVDVAAPGFAVLPVGYQGEPGAYVGTSIATPYVARWVENYLATQPGASLEQVREALGNAAKDAGEKGRDPYYGRGILTY